MYGWIKYKLKHLKRWREYAKIVAEATRKIIPDAEVYAYGSAVKGKLTILSDIDILIVTKLREKLDDTQTRKIKARILEEAEKLGLPWDAPVELHIVTPKEKEKLQSKGEKLLKL